MLVQENFIVYGTSKLHYTKAGSGTVPMLLFHGFGQNHSVFEHWIERLGKDYSLYTFDLYFHGKSTWPIRSALEKKDWKEILSLFLLKEKIERFTVLGFSLGGKFALSTVEAYPEKIIKLYLLAPDGVKTSIWYSLATYPIAVRYFFKSMILKPGRLHELAKALRRLGIVDKGLLRFAESQMDTEEKRRRVYYSWVYFRHLTFDLRKMASLLNHYQTPVMMIVGKYDKVIEARDMNRFLCLVKNHQFEIIEAGHNDLIKKAIDKLTL